MEDEKPNVADLGRATLERIDKLLSELNALNTIYAQKVAKMAKIERRDVPTVIPGLNDFIGMAKGSKHAVCRVLKSREAALKADANWRDPKADRNHASMIEGSSVASLEAIWDAIKRSHGLLALRRRFSPSPDSAKLSGPLIDAVVDNGFEWLKVYFISEKRLLREMAQEGWHPDDSSDDDEEDSDDNMESGISVVKTTAQIVKAARVNCRNTRTPQVRLFLPRITEGRIDGIDKLLKRLRGLGISRKREGDVEIIVDCFGGAFAQIPIPPLDTAFSNMLRDTNLDRLTSTLNLELTLLLSLVSDISHSQAEVKEWYSTQTVSHIEDETLAPGVRLANVLAAMRGRNLVCTQDVVREFRNAVDDIGTQTTKLRASILFGCQDLRDGFNTNRHQDEDAIGKSKALVSELQQTSIHPIPEALQLPIHIISHDEFNISTYTELITAGKLPPVATKVWETLDRVYTQSCYIYGWAADITTLTANALNTRLIEATVDKERTDPTAEFGPKMYLTSLAVSLNTNTPCPTDLWNEIKDAKHERRNAREKEASYLKKAGAWGPRLGLPATCDEQRLQIRAKRMLNQEGRQRLAGEE